MAYINFMVTLWLTIVKLTPYFSEVYTLNHADFNKAALWHRRLGHYHSQGMRRMLQHGAVKGLPNMTISNIPCSSYISGNLGNKPASLFPK